MYVLAFFKGKSERADILYLEVSNDGLSFEIVKSKIKNLAAAGFIQIWSVFCWTLLKEFWNELIGGDVISLDFDSSSE